MPFDGVASFYRALQKGKTGHHHNPFFYVSSSEWNLYDLLVDFCDHHDLPKGPFLLRDTQIKLSKVWKSGSGDHSHKLEKIQHILRLHEEKEFILIGDSGQQDAEIYCQIARENPELIKTIYIRDVRPSRHKDVLRIAENLAQAGVEMLLVQDTEKAALHALKKGYITPECIEDILREKAENQTLEPEFEQIMERIIHPV